MLRSYKTRRGRLTARQHRELATEDGLLLHSREDGSFARLGSTTLLDTEFLGRPIVMEIGFGSGGATAERAAHEPAIGLLAIDVHTPGVADLLGEVRSRSLGNVRIVEGDAIRVLAALPPDSLAGARTYFPDPWPKARHHKRRLVQSPFITLLASRVRPGGTWELATDWPHYAEQMTSLIPQDQLWIGGIVMRPDRPVTHFEQRALRDGRLVTDLHFTRSMTPAVWNADVNPLSGSSDRPSGTGGAVGSR